MLNPSELLHYSRHIQLPSIGIDGQGKLKHAKVLVVGAGGLGCPALQYLAAAGIGTLGIVDFDTVEISNLQRQILFTIADIGKSKAIVAKERLSQLNPHIQITSYNTALSTTNALEIIALYDIVVDGTDNFATRYLLNDACVLLDKPLVHGSIYQFEGQVAVFNYVNTKFERGPCYRSLHPTPPTPNSVGNCNEIGVLGVLPGIIGTLQALETLKIILNLGEVLSGELLLINTLNLNTTKYTIPQITTHEAPYTEEEFIHFNYNFFCGERINSKAKELNTEELKQLIKNQNIQLLDIRDTHELPRIPITHTSIPLAELHTRHGELQKELPLVIICQSGKRSSAAIKQLSELGFSNLYNLTKGMNAWQD